MPVPQLSLLPCYNSVQAASCHLNETIDAVPDNFVKKWFFESVSIYPVFYGEKLFQFLYMPSTHGFSRVSTMIKTRSYSDSLYSGEKGQALISVKQNRRRKNLGNRDLGSGGQSLSINKASGQP